MSHKLPLFPLHGEKLSWYKLEQFKECLLYAIANTSVCTFVLDILSGMKEVSKLNWL